jgi:hypothetical protein
VRLTALDLLAGERSLPLPGVLSPEHRLHGARDIRLAASGDVAARRKLGRYLAQRHALIVHLLGQQHGIGPRLGIRFAPSAFACGRFLAIAGRLELGNQ